jgi:hypothetical protein
MSDILTIVIGTYCQSPKKLLSTINSILLQNCENIKIIIVDDNYSKDYSDNISNNIKYLNEDKIKIVRNDTNIGVPHVFRKWFSLVTTKYFMFYCEGDILIDNSINKMIDFLNNNSKIFAVHGQEYDENGLITKSLFPNTGLYSTKIYLDSKFKNGHFGWSNASAMYRTEIVKWHDLEVINNWYWDFTFQLKLLIFSESIGYINEPLAKRDGDGRDYLTELRNNYFKINTERILLAYKFLCDNELFLLMKKVDINTYKYAIAKRLIYSCFREKNILNRQHVINIVINIYFKIFVSKIFDTPFLFLHFFKNK